MTRPAACLPAHAFGALLLASACDDLFGGACTLDVSPAIEVVIVDAVTEAPFAPAHRCGVETTTLHAGLQPSSPP
jgi:hypothetical protein